MLDSSGRFRGRFTGLEAQGRDRRPVAGPCRSYPARLEKRIAFIDGFTADLLHELKNPLAAIRGAVELALDSPDVAVTALARSRRIAPDGDRPRRGSSSCASGTRNCAWSGSCRSSAR